MMFTLEAIGILPFYSPSILHLICLEFSVALAIASGRIELPVQSSTYPTDLIDLMLLMLDLEPSRRPSISAIIDKLSLISRSTIDIS